MHSAIGLIVPLPVGTLETTVDERGGGMAITFKRAP